MKELFITLYAGITFFFYKYYSLKIIETLSPIHFIFTYSIYYFIKKIILPIYTLINGDWGLGIGDWGLGIGPNPQSPIPNPQSPIPNNCNTIFYNYFK